MPDLLIYADTIRSPDMRHHVPLAIIDPFLYAEVDGRRVAIVWSIEGDRIAAIGPAAEMVGRDVELTVVSLARNALVMAVGVQCSTPSLNVHKHITLAVNELCGGTASMSNDLTEWTPVAPLVVRGVVAEVPPN